MTVALKKKAEALAAQLKPAERVELADLLYASANTDSKEDVEQAWSDEIRRRLDDLRTGRVKAVPARQVHAAMRRKLNEIKARRVSSRRAA